MQNFLGCAKSIEIDHDYERMPNIATYKWTVNNLKKNYIKNTITINELKENANDKAIKPNFTLQEHFK